MNLLALNSSDELLSVALYADGEIAFDQLKAERNHNQFVLVLIERLLADAGTPISQIDAVAFGVGPGSFTGLRIAAAVAQGIAFALGVPTVPVSCMAAIAQRLDSDKVAVALDAKRAKIYWGWYRRNSQGLMELDGEERLTPLAEFYVEGTDWCGAGSGWDLHAKALLKSAGEACISATSPAEVPHAVQIAELGAASFASEGGKDAALAIPNYHSPYFSA